MNESLTRRLSKAAILLAAIAALSACVNKEPGKPAHYAQEDLESNSGPQNNDPIEPVNRGLFRVHEVIDGVLLQPVAHIYRGVVPDFAQTGISNALTNLASPMVLLNSLLQADWTNAGRTVERFGINSTVGVAGLFDVATGWGIPRQHSKDFGQTMGVYGIGQGPYIFIPILGPSDVRDVVGLVADFFSDPMLYILNSNGYLALQTTRGVVKRADLLPLTDRIHRDSFDVYSTYRSVYQQNREKVVKDYLGRDSAIEKEAGK